jgi:hypothetical protein
MSTSTKEIDLQEATRRDDVYNDINKVIDSLSNLPVFPSLVWVWCWDIIRNIYENNQWQDNKDNQYEEECIAKGLELKTIWDKFWEDSDKNGFTLEYGVDQLDEHIYDWLRDCDFLVSLDEAEDES